MCNAVGIAEEFNGTVDMSENMTRIDGRLEETNGQGD